MPPEERRKSGRSSFKGLIEYSLSLLDYKDLKRVEAEGEVDNISEEGVGFYTDFPLEPGHILILRMEQDDTSYAAVVRWMQETANRYRVGALLCK